MKFKKITIVVLLSIVCVIFTSCGKGEAENAVPEQEEVDKQPEE